MTQYRYLTKVITVTRDDLDKMFTAQTVAKEHIRKEDADSNAIQASLSSVAGILGLVFTVATKFSVAAGIASVILSLTSTLKASILPRLVDGTDYMIILREDMRVKGWKKVDVEMPYYELYDNPTGKTYFTFIAGEGLVKKSYK
ncbi:MULTISPECIES: hypothetical protein [Lysinibacillus]|uniref:hypothetical protein n=1 Tax=Lysinibacillus TaxID=400634 RepID=UPI00083C9FD8|nr:hypothetical protein [Lysinibacillus xylanilyticus]